MHDAQPNAALPWIRARIGSLAPRIGLILGSGMGPVADCIVDPIRLAYRDIPGFPQSHVPGHAGQLVLGSIGPAEVVAMQGRAHLYEGWSVEQATLPVRTMAELGIELLVVSNASGGIHPRFRSGQVVLIDQHLDFMRRSPIVAIEAAQGSARLGVPQRHRDPYDSMWMARAEAAALELGFALARGTYLATLGPNYETRAEYRAFARIGADMVGMSTVPEILLAAQLGVATLAFSVITNVATPDAPSKTDHAEVLDWTRSAQNRIVPLIARIIEQHFSNSTSSKSGNAVER